MGRVQKVAVVIPCYNEASGIAQVIKKTPLEKLAKHNFEISFYVVDNNSTDGTAKVAKKAGARVIHEPQKGKGHALRAGFQSLPDDIDYVVMLDGDDTYSSSEILRMIEPLHSGFCDVVVGSRLGGHIQNAAMSKFNQLGNLIFTSAVRFAYRANVTDVLTGYFAWKKQALDLLYPHLKSEGFAIEMEMVTKMAKLGLHITSVPVSYHPRAGESSLHPVKDGSRILAMFMRNLAWRPQTKQVPRRIVFVSDCIYPYMKGGKEKRLYELSKRLVALGYDVHIYTMHWWPESVKTKVEDGVTLHAICPRVEIYKGDRRTIKEGLVFGLACFKLLFTRFDILDVDHMPFFPVISAWAVCKMRRAKLFGTWHEALSQKDWADYMGRPGMVAALIERICVHMPHTITAASEHTLHNLAEIHGREKRVGLVESGIDKSYIESVIPASDNVDVLYVGRLVKGKNVCKIIEAVSILSRDYPGIRCKIVGDGLEKKRLKGLVESLGLQENFEFLEPKLEAAEIYSLMKAAKVFCLPSEREGFSIVTLEALSCGTPVITTDRPANAARRLIENGKTGSIVAIDAAEIANAIRSWVDLPEKPEIDADPKYDWQTLAERQLEVYTS